MLLPARNNQFEFFFSKTLIPEEIEKAYQPYLTRISGGCIDRCIDFLNYGIQSFSIEGVQFDPVRQSDRRTPYDRIYRSGLSPESTHGKSLTITNQLYDGHINYFMWKDLFDYYYKSAEHSVLPGIPFVRIFDGDGYELFDIGFKNILFTNIDGADFNFSSNTIDMKTFNCTFQAQEIAIRFATVR